MTSRITSYSQSQALPDPKAPPVASSPAASSGSPAGAAQSASEAVTLTPDAQTSTELLEAARAASGMDHQAVQALKAEIISGTYQVPPENLAASIVAALTETRP
jgi:flagellar biosynthesis anti-sigma factor FlgM